MSTSSALSAVEEQGNRSGRTAGRSNNAGLFLLSIADDAGFVDFFVGETEVLWTKLPVWKFACTVAASFANFSALLRRIVFVGEATLSAKKLFCNHVGDDGGRQRSDGGQGCEDCRPKQDC